MKITKLQIIEVGFMIGIFEKAFEMLFRMIV